jgi:ABC-type lipoprotein export system ATPase subunit
MSEIARMEGVGRMFGTQVVALAGIDLQVHQGEVLAITGPSGSGKSTLLNILGLLDTASSGLYTLDGRPTSRLRSADLAEMRAQLLGFVFQAYHLMTTRNVIDNVALGAYYRRIPRKERYREALLLLEQLGLGDRLTAMPPTLSGGESQRVAIARAIIGGKQLLLCDEPTGSLDSENTRLVVQTLKRYAEEGISVVIATHDPLVWGQAHREIRLVDGQIPS